MTAAGIRSSETWHVITGEYPPQPGGVGDYAYLLAGGLAAAGDEVHIWCPRYEKPSPNLTGVTVHGALGQFAPGDLRNFGHELDRFSQPRRLLVQWVPHGFGYRAMNVPFCLWLWDRARRGDYVDLMVHEPYLPFKKDSWRQSAAAAVHRLMTIILLRCARHVWVSTPSWRERLTPYAFGRELGFDWLPLTSNVPVAADGAHAEEIRRQYAPQGLLIGHFGTFGPPIVPMLHEILARVLPKAPHVTALLIGGGSAGFRDRFIREFPELRERVHAIGHLDARDPALSHHIRACDVLVQPYPDGVTSRRTTVMAALSHSRAVVTTSGPLTEAFWELSGAVALAPVGDNEAFLRLLVGFLENPLERARIGDVASEMYRNRFDVQHIVKLLRGKKMNVGTDTVNAVHTAGQVSH